MHMDPSGELHGLEVALSYAGEKQPKVCHFCWDMGKDLSALPDQFLCLLNGMHVPLSAIRSEGVSRHRRIHRMPERPYRRDDAVISIETTLII